MRGSKERNKSPKKDKRKREDQDKRNDSTNAVEDEKSSDNKDPQYNPTSNTVSTMENVNDEHNESSFNTEVSKETQPEDNLASNYYVAGQSSAHDKRVVSMENNGSNAVICQSDNSQRMHPSQTTTISEDSSTTKPPESSSEFPTPPNQTPNRPTSICSKCCWIKILVIIILFQLFIICYFLCPEDSSYSNSHDKSQDAYNDFNSYYGISSSKNYFTIQNDNMCKSGIVFKSVLPSALVDLNNSPTSFMILSDHGTGKTFLRCLYLNNLQSNDYLKVLVSNEQVDDYFQRFASETVDSLHSVWSENEFNQLILSLAVTHLVNLFNEEQFQLPKISLNEELELLTIICYYYNDLNIDKLETFVNAFLGKTHEIRYTANTMRSQILERNNYKAKPLLIHFKRDLKKLNIISQNPKKLELLLDVMEGEGHQNLAIDNAISETVFQSLIQFTQFMKNYVKRPVVFIIDSIEENRYCFNKNTDDKLSLELFYRSSLSSEILSSVMTKKFYVALFYLNINSANTIRTLVLKDKFPIYTIEWNTKLLIDYADYVLAEMNRYASNDRYKKLPNFKKLVNYTDPTTIDIIEQIQTPKDLHLFMKGLIGEMNKCSKDVNEPFIATYDNVEKAFKQIKN